MKTALLSALSLLAPLAGRPRGFSTANAEAATAEREETPQQKLARLESEIASVRAAMPAVDPFLASLDQNEKMLLEHTGVDFLDVKWRVESGLSFKHALKAAMDQVVEDKRVSESAQPAQATA